MNGRTGIIATGVLGVCILIALCVWQLQRLEWKEGVIATLEARLSAPASPLPDAFEPEAQEFTRVAIRGTFAGVDGAHGFPDAPLLTSIRPHGPGYRVIQPFDLTDGRRVMVDRGFAPVEVKNRDGAAAATIPAPAGEIEVIGALRWPEEEGDPPYGAGDNVWTARDLGVMATLFDAEPVLIVAESPTAVGEWPLPMPIAAVNVRNNHLEYAITWAALGLAWAAMTAWLAFRSPGPRRD